ncbi:hypothetical protein [Desulfohalovibrio reitneri]|uniref:hypothetical protein n=1 Tax=Desulfohalovibrio reitneri TaxID=1307759 RepID=UPI0004A7765F|nr:hypothetical protein [Desulfohalovibrio reitneri]
MAENEKPLTPVHPSGLELVYLYACPNCGREVPLIAPTQPSMARCDACSTRFPIVPVDDKSVRYIKTMTASGKAGIDPDFL